MKSSRPRRGILKVYVLLGVSLASLASVYLYYFLVLGGRRTTDYDHVLEISQTRWKPEYGHLNGPDISPTDPQVIQHLRHNFLFPPWSPDSDKYNLENKSPHSDPSMGQSDVIKSIFSKDEGRERWFIECGALDGETRSNTLFFERNWGWKGLLIEADPNNFKKLEAKHRRAWSSNTCLSTSNFPKMVSFKQAGNLGKIAPFGVGHIESGYTDVQCFPLETYFLALNISTVDYLSLDVEGSELEVLRTFPWDSSKYTINTLSVEFIHDVEGKEAIREFMRSKGYFVQTEVTNPDWLANDFIFVKKSFFNNLPVSVREDLVKTREMEKQNNIVF